MKLNVKALAIAGALIWGILAMLLTGIANLIWPSYGREFPSSHGFRVPRLSRARAALPK